VKVMVIVPPWLVGRLATANTGRVARC